MIGQRYLGLGAGLYVLERPGAAGGLYRYFATRWRENNRLREIGLGNAASVSEAEARSLVAAYRKARVADALR